MIDLIQHGAQLTGLLFNRTYSVIEGIIRRHTTTGAFLDQEVNKSKGLVLDVHRRYQAIRSGQVSQGALTMVNGKRGKVVLSASEVGLIGRSDTTVPALTAGDSSNTHELLSQTRAMVGRLIRAVIGSVTEVALLNYRKYRGAPWGNETTDLHSSVTTGGNATLIRLPTIGERGAIAHFLMIGRFTFEKGLKNGDSDVIRPFQGETFTTEGGHRWFPEFIWSMSVSESPFTTESFNINCTAPEGSRLRITWNAAVQNRDQLLIAILKQR